ncbi:MAG: hypothetical protein CUN54_08045 [Phototrophicales bacterium]|nr:MAG: hypothetical protein CUN54_08045 [Phototrophicales bacterium]
MRSSKFSLVLPDEVRKILDQIATARAKDTEQTVYASDIAREAIEEYLRKHGYSIRVEVDRGGYRRRRRKLDELLAQVDGKDPYGEFDWGDAVGKEMW